MAGGCGAEQVLVDVDLPRHGDGGLGGSDLGLGLGLGLGFLLLSAHRRGQLRR
jgi:hypothetical protein